MQQTQIFNVMNNLKSLVTKSCEGLSPTSKSEKSYGLKDFLACSTNQMLLTRGGYGSYSGNPMGGGWPAPVASAGGYIENSFNNAMTSFNNTLSSVGNAIGSFFGVVGSSQGSGLVVVPGCNQCPPSTAGPGTVGAGENGYVMGVAINHLINH